MKKSESIKSILRPKKTLILDWYDAIVTALIQFQNYDWYLIDLIAMDFNKKEKVYLLKKLGLSDYSTILRLFEERFTPNWPTWVPGPLEPRLNKKLTSCMNEIHSRKPEYVALVDDFKAGIKNVQKWPTNTKVSNKMNID